MNQNLTEVVAILDMSGSMCNLTNDTIGGYNKFIEEQKKIAGDVNLTTVFFDNEYIKKHDRTNLKDVKDISTADYMPRGCTALYDAIGKTMTELGAKLANAPEKDRPSKVLFLIITDGEENASKEYGKDRIKTMIEEQKSKYSWEFIFMGANIDAMAAGSSLGILNNVQYTANARGVFDSYAAMSTVTASYRATGSVGQVPADITNKEVKGFC